MVQIQAGIISALDLTWPPDYLYLLRLLSFPQSVGQPVLLGEEPHIAALAGLVKRQLVRGSLELRHHLSMVLDRLLGCAHAARAGRKPPDRLGAAAP